MTSKAAQYLSEVVSLTILILLGVALISGQANLATADAAAAEDAHTRYAFERRPLGRVVDARIDPVAGVLTVTSGGLEGRERSKLKRTRRPATR